MIRRPPRPTRTHSFPTRRSSDLGVRQRQPDHVQLRAGPGLMALFHAHMVVRIPHDIDPHVRADIVAREKAYAQELQESGKRSHLWRLAGEYSKISILAFPDADVLHAMLTALPFFPYSDILVPALPTLHTAN